jgi:hypothetical protein
MLLAVVLASPVLAEDSLMPQDFTAGDYAIHVTPSGVFSATYKDCNIMQTMPFIICNEKWEHIYNTTRTALSTEVKKDATKTTVCFKDNKPGMVNLQEKITLSREGIDIDCSYELAKDVPYVETCNIKLPEATYIGVPYKALMAGGKSKNGKFPVDKVDKIVFHCDDLAGLQTLSADTKAGTVDFTFTTGNWSLGDHRSATWAKSYYLWCPSFNKAGKWDMKVSIKASGKQ